MNSLLKIDAKVNLGTIEHSLPLRGYDELNYQQRQRLFSCVALSTDEHLIAADDALIQPRKLNKTRAHGSMA